jgi:L-lactate dehydrogenase complex protein LldE
MLTCLCDAFYGEVGIATVKVLEHAGCEVEFVAEQTCCGQPAFNAGAWDESRKVAGRCGEVLLDSPLPKVSPSSSCAAMVRHGYGVLGSIPEVSDTFELAEYLVREVGLEAWPGARDYQKKVALHQACHGRALGLKDEQALLLGSIPGLELVPFHGREQCCGFGGAFCVTHGTLSREIGLEKIHQVVEAGAEELVSGDMGCLMHLEGLIRKHGIPLRVRHFAEILAEVVA